MIDALQWLWPAWLWGLPAAAALPLLVHLFSRRSGTPAMFPAVRFVQAAVAQQRHSWQTLRYWLLMISRMLLLAMLCLAFARPIWWSSTADAQSGSDHLYAVLLLDASASMNRSMHGQRLFDRARAKVIEAIDSMDPSKDQAMVVVVDASPVSTLPRLTGNLAALRSQVLALQPTWEQGDMAGAMQLARQAMSQHAADATRPAGRMQMHIFGDMQRTGFGQTMGEPDWQELAGPWRVMLHPVGKAQGNIAIGQMSLSSASPVAGQRVLVTATLSNHHEEAVTATVRFEARGQRQTTTLGVGAHRQAQVAFDWQPTETGAHYISLHVEAEDGSQGEHNALTVDDQTGLFVHVGRLRRVLMMTGRAGDADDASRGGYFLRSALQATAAQLGPDVALEQTLIQNEAWQKPGGLDAYAAVVMTGITSLDEQTGDHLQRYLAAGGGVFWVVQSAEEANALLAWRADEQPIAPVIDARQGEPGVWRYVPSGQQRAGLSPGALDDPILEVFEGSLRAALLAPRFGSRLHAQATGDAKVLLRFDDGSAALAIRTWGQGRLAVLGADLSPAQSDLVKQPVFVALVHQVVRHLSPGLGRTQNPQPGQGWSSSQVMAQANEALQLQLPDQQRRQLRGSVSSDAPQALTLDGDVLSQPGPYGVYASNGQLLDGVVVELAPQESDLRQADAASIEQTTGDDDAISATANERAGGAFVSAASDTAIRNTATELWPWLVLAAMGFGVVEVLIASLAAAPTSRLTREAAHA